jgi:hypothetical protein
LVAVIAAAVRDDFPVEAGEGEPARLLDGGEPRPVAEHLAEEFELHLRRAGVGRL